MHSVRESMEGQGHCPKVLKRKRPRPRDERASLAHAALERTPVFHRAWCAGWVRQTRGRRGLGREAAARPVFLAGVGKVGALVGVVRHCAVRKTNARGPHTAELRTGTRSASAGNLLARATHSELLPSARSGVAADDETHAARVHTRACPLVRSARVSDLRFHTSRRVTGCGLDRGVGGRGVRRSVRFGAGVVGVGDDRHSSTRPKGQAKCCDCDCQRHGLRLQFSLPRIGSSWPES
jgi:hypothetical protein